MTLRVPDHPARCAGEPDPDPDPDDLSAWVAASAPRAVASAPSLLRDREQAEDVVQDCHCRRLARADGYDLPADGLKLLLTAVSHAWINRRTRRRGIFSLFGADGRPPEVADPAGREPAGDLISRELDEAIGRGLATLPVRHRAAIELKSRGHSLGEIAEILGVTPSNAGVFRAARRAALGVAAVVLVLGLAWNSRRTAAQAEAVQLVRAARAALDAGPGDRAYRIEIDLAPGMAERDPGIDFGPGEVSEPLGEAFDLFQLDLDALLLLLATEFDVTELAGVAEPAGPVRLRGTPRAGHPRPRLESITVAIDARTRLVRQVVLARLREGRPLAEVSFTFEQAGHQPDSANHLAGHLEPGAPVLIRDQRPLRRRAILRFFGSLLLPGE